MSDTNSLPLGDNRVNCIACGEEVPRSDAREYDKYGDRWQRHDKRFEYMCKPCHGDICHQPRGDLESTLVEAGAGVRDRDSFVERFLELEGAEPS